MVNNNSFKGSDRLVFDPSFQRNLLETVKEKNNLTWSEFSQKLDINENYLRNEIRMGERTMKFAWLLEIVKFDVSPSLDEILINLKDVKQKDWGRSKGGERGIKKIKRPDYHIRIEEPSRGPKLAEFVGIMMGDGSISSSPYKVSIAGHSEHDLEYLEDCISSMIKELFSISPEIYFSKSCNVAYLYVCSKELVEFLVSLGLPEGDKLSGDLRIPDWVLDDNNLLGSIVRGVFDTDGSVYRKYKDYAQIQFKMASEQLVKDLRGALIKLDFNPTKITEDRNSSGTRFKFYLSRQKEVKRFIKKLKPRNPKHIKRYKCIVSE